ncbi:MAG TPA: GyrI-like domain-containing protein, partial [Herpetosiphonaceae bacterium]
GLSPEQLRGMFRLREAQISQQLAEMRDQLGEVGQRLRQIERESSLAAYDVRIKQVEPLLVASVRAMLPDHAAVGALFGEVVEALGPHAQDALGPNPGEPGQTLVLCHDTEFRAADVDGEAAFVVRRPAPERGRMRVRELPAATMAATIHHGSYETIGAAHEAVLTWIEANGYRICGPDREVYLHNTMPACRDDPSYVTEIQYPVERAAALRPCQKTLLLFKEELMIATEPHVEVRAEQPYAGIRAQLPMQALGDAIPALHGEIFGWLAARGIAPAGAPILRYHTIDMACNLDIEVGVPVAAPFEGDGRVTAQTLPAGRYAALVYVGVENGVPGNAALLDWAKERGLALDSWDDPAGEAFAGRYETFIDGPEDSPDMATWKTEVAMKLKD